MKGLVLAPLRGVTIRAFRRSFAPAIREAGFEAAVSPFIPANPGIKPTAKYMKEAVPFEEGLVPQVITKDPASMGILLKAFKDMGYKYADLNAGCPFAMVAKRGRGSGLMRKPDLLERLLATGCEIMGEGRFSVKMRLGIESPREIMAIMPILNRYPLNALTIHARTAKEMYSGSCHRAEMMEAAAMSSNPVVVNGDYTVADAAQALPDGIAGIMVGRSFIRELALRDDAGLLARAYLEESFRELGAEHGVLGRMKELLSYWAQTPSVWARRWNSVKMCRRLDELAQILCQNG